MVEQGVRGNCELLFSRFAYVSLLCIHLVLPFCGFLLNFTLIPTIIRTKFFPKTVSLLLTSMTIAILVSDIMSMVRNVSELRTVVSGVITTTTLIGCTIWSIQLIFHFLTIFSVIALGVERWLVTRRLKQDTNCVELLQAYGEKKSIKSATVLVVATWVAAVVIAGKKVVEILSNQNTADETQSSAGGVYNFTHQTNASSALPSCFCPNQMSDSSVHARVIATFVVGYSFEIFIMYVYLKTWNENKKKFAEFNINSQSHSLETRFEIRQNIRTTGMMLPTVLTHGIVWGVIGIVVSLHPFFFDLNFATALTSNILILTAVRVSMDLYTVIHPILIFASSKHLRSNFLCRKPVPSQVTPAESHGNAAPVTVNVNSELAAAPGVPTTNSRRNRWAVEFRVNPQQGVEILKKVWEEKIVY